MLQAIREVNVLVASSPEPHAVAVDGATVFISSRATKRIDVMKRDGWTKVGEIDPPGMPWGMVYGNGDLVMTCGEPPDDNRHLRRYSTTRGWHSGAIDCPDDAGSHLAIVGDRIVLAQWYNKRLLVLDEHGEIERVLDAPHEIAGVTFANGAFYLVCTDDEDHGDYWLTRLDPQTGVAKDVATIPFHARGLAFDGTYFWTNHRAGDRTIVFEPRA